MKNKNDLDTPIKYKVYRVLPRIYFVECADQFDLNMIFARFQEFYESDNPNIKGKKFEFMKWVRWYTQKKGTQNNLFTYTDDWSGFNIPSEQIDLCLADIDIHDFNMYDAEMTKIVRKIRENEKESFYLIGATTFDSHAFKHEIAHGFYYLNGTAFNKKENREMTYREWSELNTKKVHTPVRKKMYACLKDYGYDQSVFDDEFQAFMSTGFTDIIKNKAPELKNYTADFKNMFNTFFDEKKIKKDIVFEVITKLSEIKFRKKDHARN